MNTYTLKTFLVAALFTLMISGGITAKAATLEGIVQGYGCMVIEKLCAVDRMDPRLAAEKNFVIVDKNGTYYFISNVDSSLLSENILNQVRITGDVNSKYHTVTADKLELYSNGSWHEAWSMKKEKEELDAFNYGLKL